MASQPSLHVEYKSSHVKQYFKEQHALRTETTINNPMDFYVRKAVDNLPAPARSRRTRSIASSSKSSASVTTAS